MRTRVRAGPEPMRQRLDEIDADEVAAEVRELVLFAQTGVGAPSRAPQRLVEVVQVAHDAARARGCLRERSAVPPRWLAALGGVATSRVRQLIRDAVLRRVGPDVAFDAAWKWLEGTQPTSAARVRAVTNRRLVAVDPSWWHNHQWKATFLFELESRIESLAPAGHAVGYDHNGTPYFEVLPGTMTSDQIEEWRARIRSELEALDPDKGGWTSESDAPIHW